MKTLTFRVLATGETFSTDKMRHLCSPMQELRDSVPAQFHSEMDWAKFFAASGAPEPPDGYAVAIAAAKPTAVRPPSARMATGHTGAPDGYADNLPTADAPGVDPLDGYAVALSQRADVHPFPTTTDGYAAAIARRKVS